MLNKIVLIFLACMTFFVLPLLAEEVETGRISGQLMIKDGGPLSGGMVVFFRADEGPVPDPHKYLRIPDEVADLDEKGKFNIPLPAGIYFMGAVKRLSGELIGPPLDGDYFFISRDAVGKPVIYLIEKGINLNVGIKAEAVPFKRMIPDMVTGVSGTIYDMKGKPVEGAIVFAYFTDTMTGLPPFASYKTGKDGNFFITVSHPGKYYLRVRSSYGGGPPVPGAIMGAYGEEIPAGVLVETGEVTKGINIKVVRRFERGPKMKDIELGVDKSIKQDMKKQIEESATEKK